MTSRPVPFSQEHSAACASRTMLIITTENTVKWKFRFRLGHDGNDDEEVRGQSKCLHISIWLFIYIVFGDKVRYRSGCRAMQLSSAFQQCCIRHCSSPASSSTKSKPQKQHKLMKREEIIHFVCVCEHTRGDKQQQSNNFLIPNVQKVQAVKLGDACANVTCF